MTAEAAACGSSETPKDGIQEQAFHGDQAPRLDVVTELQEALRQARGDLLLLKKSNKGLLIQLRRVRSSNTALQKKLDDKTRMLEKEQEFNAALVDGLRQVGTRTCSEASGRYETVACWEYLEREPDSWRRYRPDAEQSLERSTLGQIAGADDQWVGFQVSHQLFCHDSNKCGDNKKFRCTLMPYSR